MSQKDMLHVIDRGTAVVKPLQDAAPGVEEQKMRAGTKKRVRSLTPLGREFRSASSQERNPQAVGLGAARGWRPGRNKIGSQIQPEALQRELRSAHGQCDELTPRCMCAAGERHASSPVRTSNGWTPARRAFVPSGNNAGNPDMVERIDRLERERDCLMFPNGKRFGEAPVELDGMS